MNKAIKLVMTGLLVSANMLAQETDSIQQYGRGISVDWKESTTAGGMVTAGQLSHKTSVNPSNSLFGSVPGLYVLQNAGQFLGRWCYYVCTWFGDYKQQKPADIG